MNRFKEVINLKLENFLEKRLNISSIEAKKIVEVFKEYEKSGKKKINIKLPSYTLAEELINSITHGIGALFSILCLILMVVKASGLKEEVSVSLFGASMIVLYTMSTIYHALSKNLEGKKILRVLDHSNVYLLVYGTYIPISLLGVGDKLGWILFSFVSFITLVGIVLTCIKIDKFQVLEVICHLLNGWSILIGINKIINNMGKIGLIYLLLGGIMYTLGSILYGIGTNKKYMHSIFHIFCLLGTMFHFFAIYFCLL